MKVPGNIRSGRLGRLCCSLGTAAAVSLAVVVHAPSAAAAGGRIDINLGDFHRVAEAMTRGMDCSFAFEKATDHWAMPAVVIPRDGSAIAVVGRKADSEEVQILRVDASDKASIAVGSAVRVTGTAGESRVCDVVTNDGVSTVAVQLVAVDGTRQWWVSRTDSDISIALDSAWQSRLTSAASVSPDGARVYVVAEPCDACGEGYQVITFDAATGVVVGSTALPIPTSNVVRRTVVDDVWPHGSGSFVNRDCSSSVSGTWDCSFAGVNVAAHESGVVVSASTQSGLHLWSLDSNGAGPVASRVIAPDEQHFPAITDNCSVFPGIQVAGGSGLVTSQMRLDFSEFAGEYGLDLSDPNVTRYLPIGQTVRVVDLATLADRAVIDAYRPHHSTSSVCPGFGSDGSSVVMSGQGFGSTLGDWLGRDEGGAGALQQGKRQWGPSSDRIDVGNWAVSFELASEEWGTVSETGAVLNQSLHAPLLHWVDPVTIDQSPAVLSLMGKASSFLAGDFRLYHDYVDSEGEFGKVYSDIIRQGSTYRYVKPHGYWKNKGLVVTYASPKMSCTRTTTKKLPDTLSADRRATWSCTKGSKAWDRAGKLAEAAVANNARVGKWSPQDSVVVDGDLNSPEAPAIQWDQWSFAPFYTNLGCSTAGCSYSDQWEYFVIREFDEKLPRIAKGGKVR